MVIGRRILNCFKKGLTAYEISMDLLRYMWNCLLSLPAMILESRKDLDIDAIPRETVCTKSIKRHY